MTQDVRIEDLKEKLLDDRISVCGDEQPVKQLSVQKGIREKKQWLRKMLEESGSPSKILYVDNKPVGQILYYPESSIPFLKDPDPKMLHVSCSFVHLAQQGKGHGKALFKSVVNDAKTQAKYDRLETVSFDPPGCGLSQTAFWKRMGFKERPEGEPHELEYPINGGLTRPRKNNSKRVREKGVKIFYEPTCIFTHHFNDKIAEAVRVIDPNVSVELVNMWEKPEMAKRRALVKGCVYINGKPMKHSIFEGEEFKRELQTLLNPED